MVQRHGQSYLTGNGKTKSSLTTTMLKGRLPSSSTWPNHIPKSYPNMSLSNLSALAHARVNGTFKDGGAFMTADPRLAKAINKLCCMRKHSLGRITVLLRRWKNIDEAAEATNRKQHTAAKYADSTAAAARRAVKVFNVHSEIPLRRPYCRKATTAAQGAPASI